jgi:glutathione S-transferase
VTESFAIYEYISLKYAPMLLGTTPQERAKVSMLAGVCKDINSALRGPCYRSDAVKEELSAQAIKLMSKLADYIS